MKIKTSLDVFRSRRKDISKSRRSQKLKGGKAQEKWVLVLLRRTEQRENGAFEHLLYIRVGLKSTYGWHP